MKLPILTLIPFIIALQSIAQTFDLPDGAKLNVIEVQRSKELKLFTSSMPVPKIGALITSTSSSFQFLWPPSFEKLELKFKDKAWDSSSFTVANPCLIMVFKLTDNLGKPIHSEVCWTGSWEAVKYNDNSFRSIEDTSRTAPFSISLLDPETDQTLQCYGPLSVNIDDGRSWVWMPNYPREDKTISLILHRHGQPDFTFEINNPARTKPVRWSNDTFPAVRKGDGWVLTSKGLSQNGKGQIFPSAFNQIQPQKGSHQTKGSWQVLYHTTEDNLGNVAGRFNYNGGIFHLLERADQVRMNYHITRTAQYRWALADVEVIGTVAIPGPAVKAKKPVITGIVGTNKINLSKLTFWQSKAESDYQSGVPDWTLRIEGEDVPEKAFLDHFKDREFTLIVDGESRSSVHQYGVSGGTTSNKFFNVSFKGMPLRKKKIYSYDQNYLFSGALNFPAGTKVHVALLPKLKPEEVQFTVNADKFGKQ